MPTQVRYRRGTTAEHSTFTGAAGEMTIDTTKNTCVVHDGSTIGGHPLATAADLSVSQGDITTLQGQMTTAQGDITSLESRSRKNLLINGNFDIWQRGTSGSLAYVADRWFHVADGGGGVYNNHRRPFTLGQTAVPNEPTYFSRVECTTASTGSTYNSILQRIEDVRTAAEKTVTVSVWAKGGAGGETFKVQLSQRMGTGGSPSPSVFFNVISPTTLTTSWQKFVGTVSVPSLSGKTLGTDGNHSLEIAIHAPINTVAYIDVAQVQLEIGDAATDFEYRPLADELALCQRYYEKYDNCTVGFGDVTSGNATVQGVYFSTVKRASPTLTVTHVAGGRFNGTGIATQDEEPGGFMVYQTVQSTGANGWFRFDYEADAEL